MMIVVPVEPTTPSVLPWRRRMVRMAGSLAILRRRRTLMMRGWLLRMHGIMLHRLPWRKRVGATLGRRSTRSTRSSGGSAAFGKGEELREITCGG